MQLTANKPRTEYKYFKEGKPSHMTEERIRQLEDLHFEWNVNQKTPAMENDQLID